MHYVGLSMVKVYSFNSKSTVWWQQTKSKMQQYTNVQCYRFDWKQIQVLAGFVERTMNWSLSISGDSVYVAAGEQECELLVTELA